MFKHMTKYYLWTNELSNTLPISFAKYIRAGFCPFSKEQMKKNKKEKKEREKEGKSQRLLAHGSS